METHDFIIVFPKVDDTKSWEIMDKLNEVFKSYPNEQYLLADGKIFTWPKQGS